MFHRKEAVLTLMKRLQGAFIYLFHSEYGNTPKIWEFFAVLVVNIAAEQKKKLLSELRYAALFICVLTDLQGSDTNDTCK